MKVTRQIVVGFSDKKPKKFYVSANLTREQVQSQLEGMFKETFQWDYLLDIKPETIS